MSWVACALLLAAYAAATRRAPGWPARRTLAWAGGTVVLAAALGGLGEGAGDRLSVHMVQHGLLGFVAAPLLVAAAPVRLALRAADRGTRRALAGVVASRGARALTHPVAGLTVFTATLLVVHVPAVYDAALRSPLLHAAEHAALFWSAVALWVPLLAPSPVARRPQAVGTLGVLLAAMAAMGLLGAWMSGTSRVLYTAYGGPGALADQHLAGGLMWMGGMAVVLPLLLWAAWRALAEEERRQRVREAVR